VQASDAAEAESAYREGDYPRCIRALHRLLSDDLAFFESDAACFAAEFPTSERSQFWTPPKDFYPDDGKLESIFDFIYARGVWGGGSGAGSDLKHTVLYVAYVQALMDKHDIRSVLDLGCGDWRFSRYLDFSGRNYVGLDIVPSVVAANQTAFGASNIRFEHADVSAYPKFAPHDLILCKDVLQHLSNARVSAILSRCSAGHLALITNDYYPENLDCRDGETRPLNVTAPPFNLAARPVLRFGKKVTFLTSPVSGGATQ
jgi:2-polyprenyl-3-methyl-5-hydroxy-6-metoxy-1,4-benzoquinol methylase